MKKHYIGIGILTIVCFFIGIGGFIVAGFPISQHAASTDSQRETDFTNITYQVQGYYNQQHLLPTSLNEISDFSPNNDPDTGSPYVYQRSNSTTYKLCTGFATEVPIPPNRNGNMEGKSIYSQANMPSSDVFHHKKGYDCVTYHITSLLTPTPSYGHNPYNNMDTTSVLHPNNSDIVCIGKPYTITWQAPLNIQGVAINLYQPAIVDPDKSLPIEGVMRANTEQQSQQAKGTYVWNVPASINGTTLTPGYGYRIELMTYAASSGYSSPYYSDLFTLADCSTISIPPTLAPTPRYPIDYLPTPTYAPLQ